MPSDFVNGIRQYINETCDTVRMWSAGELFKAGYNYTNASACEFVRDAHQFIIENWPSSMPTIVYRLRVIENLCCAFNRARFVTHFGEKRYGLANNARQFVV